MKTQQEAEKEEHQRIKNLVLNYDLRESEDNDGEARLSLLRPNSNIHISSTGHERSNSHHHNRLDSRSAKEKAGQRVRKLQLSDVDWYGNSPKTQSAGVPVSAKARPAQAGSVLQARSGRAKPGRHEVSQAGKMSMSSYRRMCSSPGARQPIRLAGSAVV